MIFVSTRFNRSTSTCVSPSSLEGNHKEDAPDTREGAARVPEPGQGQAQEEAALGRPGRRVQQDEEAVDGGETETGAKVVTHNPRFSRTKTPHSSCFPHKKTIICGKFSKSHFL